MNYPVITRQLIVDAKKIPIGYELDGIIDIDLWPLQMVDLKLSSGVSLFVRVLPKDLNAETIHRLAVWPKVVLNFLREDVLTKELATALHRAGIKFCLTDPEINAFTKEILLLADYMKIDIKKIGVNNLVSVHKYLSTMPAKVLLHKISTEQEFKEAGVAGYFGCQGSWLTDVSKIISTTPFDPTYTTIFNILNLVQSNADIKTIETALKQDMAISVKLLRYINSVSFGLPNQIRSYSHAINLLGYDKMYKWCSFLLLTAKKGEKPGAIVKLAMLRARLAEQIADGKLFSPMLEKLFIAAEFTMLPALLNMNMEHIMAELNIDNDIKDALVNDTGPLCKYIALIKEIDGGNQYTIHSLAEELELDIEKLNEQHLNAITWVEMFNF